MLNRTMHCVQPCSVLVLDTRWRTIFASLAKTAAITCTCTAGYRTRTRGDRRVPNPRSPGIEPARGIAGYRTRDRRVSNPHAAIAVYRTRDRQVPNPHATNVGYRTRDRRVSNPRLPCIEPVHAAIVGYLTRDRRVSNLYTRRSSGI